MSKIGWAVGVVAFVAIVGSCNNHEATSSSATPTPVAAPATSTSAPASVAPVSATTAPAPGAVPVTRVIDGDTFEIAGGERVRVLGIDSCEMDTYGGPQAKQSAEVWLGGESVVLQQEPGVDRDRYGRLLRYVATPYGDFGETMVGSTHTGVARGSSDASPARLSALRAQDGTGRDCSAPEYAPSTTEYDVDVDVDVDDDDGLPDGALTGGYCARKWWC